jgi:hypothetical protein
MPEVHNFKSQAKDFYGRGRAERGRRAKTARSLFVLIALWASGTYVSGAVDVRLGRSAEALPTVKGPERSVSRASEASAKRRDRAEASKTQSFRHFQRA